MSRRNRSKVHPPERSPCPVRGSTERPDNAGSMDCNWDEYNEAMEKPGEGVRPNDVSLNEARFILREAGIEVLQRANCARVKGDNLRAKFRAMMKESNAHHP